MGLAVTITSWIWLALEIGLVVRDRRRGKGSASNDRGTRLTVVALTVIATVGSALVQVFLGGDRFLGLPGADAAVWAPIAGLALMWVGLVFRYWSITVLGSSFRTTVEVDEGQQVVDRGPYRVLRHPSYTGVLLIMFGYGLAAANWLSLVLTLVLPVIALSYRISVEERALLGTMGAAYQQYRARTHRLVPGLW
jgi:protein-S-isoprenylcysteine O-methyltransferase Ste14